MVGERPSVRVPVGPRYFPPLCHLVAQCGCAARATSINGACLVVPPLFQADSGTNLMKQGENVKGRPMAQQLSCLTDSERLWVRVPVGPRFFPPL